jgi:hypothetical protein
MSDLKKLPNEKVDEINRQLDNFFEALFISPLSFEPEVLQFLANREKELTWARHAGWAVGGVVGCAGYYIYRLKKGFYFKNFMRMLICGFITGYIGGRMFEYQLNMRKFRSTLVEIARKYNITDAEIFDLHNKLTEEYLREKQAEEHKKFSLDKVQIKF